MVVAHSGSAGSGLAGKADVEGSARQPLCFSGSGLALGSRLCLALALDDGKCST